MNMQLSRQEYEAILEDLDKVKNYSIETFDICIYFSTLEALQRPSDPPKLKQEISSASMMHFIQTLNCMSALC